VSGKSEDMYTLKTAFLLVSIYPTDMHTGAHMQNVLNRTGHRAHLIEKEQGTQGGLGSVLFLTLDDGYYLLFRHTYGY
jgi:hypothetical protein